MVEPAWRRPGASLRHRSGLGVLGGRRGGGAGIGASGVGSSRLGGMRIVISRGVRLDESCRGRTSPRRRGRRGRASVTRNRHRRWHGGSRWPAPLRRPMIRPHDVAVQRPLFVQPRPVSRRGRPLALTSRPESGSNLDHHGSITEDGESQRIDRQPKRRAGRSAGAAPSRRPHDRHGRHDGRRQVLGRPPPRQPPRPALRRRRHRDRAGRQRHHPRDLRAATARPISATASGASSSGCSTARRRCWRPAAAPSSTPRRAPRSRRAAHLDLAQGRPRPAPVARQAPLATGRCSRPPIPAAIDRPADRRALPGLCRGRRSTSSRATSPMTS